MRQRITFIPVEVRRAILAEPTTVAHSAVAKKYGYTASQIKRARVFAAAQQSKMEDNDD